MSTERLPTLTTERLILRPFNETDASVVQQLAGKFAIADTTLNIPHPYEDGVAEAWIATHQSDYSARKGAHFAIVLKEDNQMVGAISLMGNLLSHRAELGYWIAENAWGNGYCTEAAEEILRFGFTAFDLRRVFACHFVRNPASGRVMEKLGMVREGVLRGHVLKWDCEEDLQYYGIHRSEWMRRQKI